jgi:hypothetical protein
LKEEEIGYFLERANKHHPPEGIIFDGNSISVGGLGKLLPLLIGVKWIDFGGTIAESGAEYLLKKREKLLNLCELKMRGRNWGKRSQLV